MGDIEQAITVLEAHITAIHTVSEWAEKMGYESTDYFSRKVRNHYGVSPKQLIVKIKIQKVKDCLRESPEEIYYCIARKLGFIADNALYKFVKRHTGKSITGLKRESEKGG